MGADSSSGERSTRPDPRDDVEGGAPGVPFAGVDQAEWDDLVLLGRERGSVHAEDLTHVLRHVELTGDVLVEVQSAM